MVQRYFNKTAKRHERNVLKRDAYMQKKLAQTTAQERANTADFRAKTVVL